MEKEITSKSVKEVIEYIDSGKLSTREVVRAYNDKLADYNSYWINNDMKRRRPGHAKLKDKYNILSDSIKKRSIV